MTTATTKKSYMEIEAIIEERIAAESEIYDLDSYDIADIRLDCYKENGWSYDPFPEEEEEEEEDLYDEDQPRYSDMYHILADLGMRQWDFF